MVTFCKNCYDTKQKECITGYAWALKEGVINCPWCHKQNSLIKIDFPDFDMCDLLRVSNSKEFIDAMIELHKKDPIEYQLKMSQFRIQANQILQSEQQNIPKCPTCGSTKLSKVSTMSKAGSVFMWGLLSQKVKKTWHCDNCKYEW